MCIAEVKCLMKHQYQKKIRIECDRQSSLNQEVKKSRCNRVVRLTSETVSDTQRDRKKTLVNKYVVDLNTQ